MHLVSKFFDELTTRELYELLKARAEIFVVEQNCVYQDLDDQDYNGLHVFYEENRTILAYLRAFPKSDSDQVVQMGRFLTITHGLGHGGKLLKEGLQQIIDKMHPKEIYIHAQCYATGFYEKAGFQICSEEFLEDDIPHVEMRLRL